METRVVNPVTGGEKGSKPARFDLIPVAPLTHLAEQYGKGASKYADRNWERGYQWSLSYAALMRHLTAWWGGEDIDAELQSNHLDAVMFHVMALREFTDTHPELDDRPSTASDSKPIVGLVIDTKPNSMGIVHHPSMQYQIFNNTDPVDPVWGNGHIVQDSTDPYIQPANYTARDVRTDYVINGVSGYTKSQFNKWHSFMADVSINPATVAGQQ